MEHISWERHFIEQRKARLLRMEQSALRYKAATIAAAALAAEKKAAALVAAKRAAAEAAAVARALSLALKVGSRDDSAVRRGVRRIESGMLTDSDLAKAIQELRLTIATTIDHGQQPTAAPMPTAKPPQYPPIKLIIAVVANHYGLQLSELIGPQRTARLVEPRHVVFYLSRTLTQHSLPTIGRAVGKRDHTSALYAFRKIAREANGDADLAGMLDGLARLITKLNCEQNG